STAFASTESNEKTGTQPRLRLLARFGSIVALVAALAAIQLLPFLDLLKHSQRNSGFADSQWAMPWWGWANLFVPLFRTFPGSIGVHAQPGQAWVYSYYCGVAVLFLAVLGGWKVRERRVLLLGGATLLTLWLALGDDGGLYRAVREVFPGIGFMRYPVKFVVTATFCVPLLAAFGAKFLLEMEGDFAARRKSALTLLGIVAGIIAVLAVLGAMFPVNDVPGTVAAWSGAGRLVILALLGGAFVWWRRSSSQRMKFVATFALILVFWADAMSNGPRANPTVPNWTYEPGFARKELHLEPAPRIGESRVMLSLATELTLNSLPLTNAVDNFLYGRLGLMANFNLLDGIPKVGGSFSVYFPELERIMFLLYSASNPPPALIDFLGVTHFTAPGKNIAWEHRPSAMPWITAGQQPVFTDAGITSAALAATNFNPREIVFLTPEARSFATATNRVAARVNPLSFTAHRVEFEVESPQPTLAVVSQNFYRNWHPTVNGQPVPLLRANLAFQAVEVPAGRSRVVLVYRERMLVPGAAVSGGALILLLALVWKAWKKKPANHES
ncbi:MAG: YfhO family protein, partial [Verrucomicrobia bacterium]|nr:YfhO family protein [Verrucomicrobiota bacterium]